METRTETTNRPNIQGGGTTGRTNAQAQDTTGNILNTAKDTLNQGMEKINRSTSDAYEATIDYCKKNPGAALGIAIASGVTIGFLLGRSSKSRFDDTLLGAVATAAIRTALDRWR